MRISFRLVLWTVVISVTVALFFSLWQARREEARFFGNLERRSATAAATLVQNLRPALGRDEASMRELLDRTVAREKLKGIALYDAAGNLLSASPDLPETVRKTGDIAALVENDAAHSKDTGIFLRLRRHKAYLHALKFGAPASPYFLALLHKTEPIEARLGRIWLLNFLRALLQVFLLSAAILLLTHLSVVQPVRAIADWIKEIRLGEYPAPPRKAQKFLEPVVREVQKMAKSLQMARQAAEDEARLRLNMESLWTPERLKEFVRVKLQGRPLFVVANREPYMHVRKGKDIECVVPASGLVTAIEPVLKACGGTWVAQATGDADRETADEQGRLRVPPEEPQYTLKRVWISKEEEEGFYYGFSNEGLWPLCHIAHTRPIFRTGDWEKYEAVNKKFARVLLDELEGTVEPCVLIQDYHFALLPKLIKDERPDARVTIFWHIPWPNPESFGICPWQKEILTGMLGADIIGFHTQFHCNNFLETADRFLESRIDYEHFSINREGQTTSVKPFPISIAFLNGGAGASHDGSLSSDKAALLKPHGLRADFVGVGVDRLDYTKGILERFASVEQFLVSHREFQGAFTFVELAAPSRTLIPKYQNFMAEVEAEAERINARFKQKNWKPILFLKKHHSHKDILPFYKAADLCLVTSLHDGMNLVAKEFVQARDDEKGVLILSQFTGASRELTDAIIINPYDIGQTAEAIRAALEMPAPEQAERMRRMRNVLKDRNIFRWAADLVSELAQVRLSNEPALAKTNGGYLG